MLTLGSRDGVAWAETIGGVGHLRKVGVLLSEGEGMEAGQEKPDSCPLSWPWYFSWWWPWFSLRWRLQASLDASFHLCT